MLHLHRSVFRVLYRFFRKKPTTPRLRWFKPTAMRSGSNLEEKRSGPPAAPDLLCRILTDPIYTRSSDSVNNSPYHFLPDAATSTPSSSGTVYALEKGSSQLPQVIRRSSTPTSSIKNKKFITSTAWLSPSPAQLRRDLHRTVIRRRPDRGFIATPPRRTSSATNQ